MDRSTLYKGYLFAFGAFMIWTSFVIISRMGGKSTLTPYDIVALRFVVGTIFLLPFCKGVGVTIWFKNKYWILSIINLCYALLVYSGFQYIPAAQAAILLPGIQPFLVVFILWFFWKQLPSKNHLIGSMVISVGIFCVAIPHFFYKTESANNLIGYVLIVLSAVIWALYSILIKRWKIDPWLSTRFFAYSITVIYLPIYLLLLPKGLENTDMATILLQGLFQGLGPTVIGMLFFLKAIAYIGAEKASAFIALAPVSAGLLAIPLLNETITPWIFIGLIAVSVGAIITIRPNYLNQK